MKLNHRYQPTGTGECWNCGKPGHKHEPELAKPTCANRNGAFWCNLPEAHQGLHRAGHQMSMNGCEQWS